MDPIKRNIIIISILSLTIPLIFAFQYGHKANSSDQYSIEQSMQNLDGEIEIIHSVSKDILTNLDINKASNDQMKNFNVNIPVTMRDPFVFPEDLMREQSRRWAELQKKKAAEKTKTDKKKNIKKKAKPKLTLAGIIFDQKEPMAIINGDIYKVSDTIAEYTIRSISEEGVQLISSTNKALFLETPVIE